MISSTELLVEHIISGILAVIWILGLAFIIIEIDINFLKSLENHKALLAFIFIPIAYPLGIFIDTLADQLLQKKGKNIKKTIGLSMSKTELIHRLKDENIRDYFTYTRFKTRVIRSSMLNFLMIAIFCSLLIFIKGTELGISYPKPIGLSVAIIFMLFCIVAYLIWVNITRTTNMKVKELESKLLLD